MGVSNYQRTVSPLDTQTVLIMFIIIVVVVIYLISLLLVMGRNAKKILQLHNRKYYLIILAHIVSKLILCAILVVQIVIGIANKWANIDPDTVELMIKVGILLSDLSVIQLFLVALETYLTHCLSAISESHTKKKPNFLKYGIKIMQIFVGLAIIIPLILCMVGIIPYNVLNAIDLSLNISIIMTFLVAFLYLNFQMTGIMLDNRINNVIKVIYKLQLVILISRVFSIVFQLIIAFYILPHSFQEEIALLQADMIKEKVLAIIFLATLLFLLLTEAIPIMYSLKSAVFEALNFKSDFISEQKGIQQPFLHRQQGQLFGDHLTIKLANFSGLTDIEISDSHSIWIYKKGQYEGKSVLVRVPCHQISNFIIEEIENQINNWNQINLRSLSKLAYFFEGQVIYLAERYYETNLDAKAGSLKSSNQIIRLSLKIAEGIRQLHENQIIHGCLSPRHIFFQEDQVLFNGLGLKSFKKYLSLITGYTDKTLYTAIQYLGDKNNTVLKPKISADIYSFGIIFYQLITNNRQYRQLSLQELKNKFVYENFRPKLPNNISPEVKILIRKCWNEQAESRPNINQVIENLKKMLYS